jgi:hypothetical protein
MRFNDSTETQIKLRIFILHVILSGDVVYNPIATQWGHSNICRSSGLKTALHHFFAVHSIFNTEELIGMDLRTGQDRTGQDRTGQDRTGQDRTGQDRTGQDRLIRPVRSAHVLSRYEQSNVRYKQLKQKLVL